MEKIFHPFHIVTLSPWPIISGGGVLISVISLINLFIYSDFKFIYFSLIMILLVVFAWWRDVVRERTFQGGHSGVVVRGLIFGIILFIVREIFFFLSFFWAFFHSRLSPVVELGNMWPPCGVDPLNAFQVPLLNTVILLSSGVRVTWAHQAILGEDKVKGNISLALTWVLGIYFLSLQWIEYRIAIFGIRDSVFGSTFFISTGFHGFHVIIGTLFLFVIWIRLFKSHFRNSHHFGFECAAWYWHFVDVVWLFLFSVVYWWGALL